jgi:hypothetical protein
MHPSGTRQFSLLTETFALDAEITTLVRLAYHNSLGDMHNRRGRTSPALRIRRESRPASHYHQGMESVQDCTAEFF